ncbi:MAG: hypothetical protein BWY92_01468 [Firmicutes bacterium ADurb.BinA052]|nr:MAG: hypothetical protein BWY92_01468 [Firmicutes bacterium ADurb.BinA052]
MEPDDLLAHYVHIGRPVPRKPLRIIYVSNGSKVVRERIKPHVHHMARSEWHRDAPREGGARYAQIFQPALYEVDHLMASARRLDEAWILFYMAQ